MPMGPRRRPGKGVVGTVATAAVVGGTIGAVRHHQDKKWSKEQQADAQTQQDQAAAEQAAYEQGQQESAQAQQDQQIAEMQQQLESMQAQQAAGAAAQPAAEAAAPAGAGDDMMSQLNQLAQLHQGGVLSDDEFAAAKAKLLA